MQMQTDYLAKYLARGGSTAPWMGFHGAREADPRWGNSGLVPDKATVAGGPGHGGGWADPPVLPGHLRGKSDPINPSFIPSWNRGLFREGVFAPTQKEPTIERPSLPGQQDVSLPPGDLRRRESGALLRASNQMQAAALKHEITGSASLHVKLASGLAPVSGVKTKGSLFKEIRLDRAAPPLASTIG
jgi:hypothetical protein